MANSISGDLKTRIKRFGKTSKNVPGTYMSAAGVQSEVHPTTLARIAVHEAHYRKQVHVYRQDLHNTVHDIRRDQREHRRLLQQYKRKKYYNRHHRLKLSPVPPGVIPTENTVPPRVMHASHTNDAHNIMKILPDTKEKTTVNPHYVEHVTTDLLKLAAIDITNDVASENKTNVIATPNEVIEQGPMEDQPKPEIKHGLMEDKPDTEHNTEVTDHKPDKEILEKTEIKQSNSINNVNKIRAGIKSISSDVIITVSNQKEDNIMSNQENIDTVIDTKITSKSEIFNFPVKSHPKRLNRMSDTSSFMELIRMKNNNSLVKNLKMIDKLVNDSKSKRFAYLTRVTEGTDKLVKPEVINEAWSQGHRRKPAKILPDLNHDNMVQQRKNNLSVAWPSLIQEKEMDKFLHSEKIKSDNYKDDVTWQESLASIRNVYYIQ